MIQVRQTKLITVQVLQSILFPPLPPDIHLHPIWKPYKMELTSKDTLLPACLLHEKKGLTHNRRRIRNFNTRLTGCSSWNYDMIHQAADKASIQWCINIKKNIRSDFGNMRRDVNQKKKEKDMKCSSVMNHDLHLVIQRSRKTGCIVVTNAPTCRNVTHLRNLKILCPVLCGCCLFMSCWRTRCHTETFKDWRILFFLPFQLNVKLFVFKVSIFYCTALTSVACIFQSKRYSL